jgi:hypothetical protein
MERLVPKVLVANFVMTVAFAGLFAPASERFASSFGLTRWAAVAPFFVLPLYIGPAILTLRPIGRWYLRGPLVGFLFALPLACWTVLPNYPVASKVPIILATGVFQGLWLAWFVHRGLGRGY